MRVGTNLIIAVVEQHYYFNRYDTLVCQKLLWWTKKFSFGQYRCTQEVVLLCSVHQASSTPCHFDSMVFVKVGLFEHDIY